MPDPALVEPIQGISATLLVIVSVGLVVTAVGDVLVVVASRSRLASGLLTRALGVRARLVDGTAPYRATSSVTAMLLSLPDLGTGTAFVTEPAYYGTVAASLLVTVGLRDRVGTATSDPAWRPGCSTR